MAASALPAQPPHSLPTSYTPALLRAGGVLLQLADACGSYLSAAAREALLAEAGRQTSHATVQTDSQEELEKEMGRNPLEAAAHEASEL